MKEWFRRNWSYVVSVLVIGLLVVMALLAHPVGGWDKPVSQMTISDAMLLVFVASLFFRRD